ncbi:MAG: HlyD family efflux transporter periplasmic adaptor subunit [Terriglobales bacterium]
MNLTQVLNVALPEMPARTMALHYPRLHPDVVFKEHIIDGQPVVRVFVPGVEAIFNIPRQNWELVRLFDGQRTYEDVADLYFKETGLEVVPEDVRGIGDDLEAIEFWYKTPQEKNVALMRKTAEERRKILKKKKKWGDLGLITFPAFNPDKFLDWLHEHLGFIYTWWFTLITLGAFAFMVGIFVTHWNEVSRDTWQFYNFSDKTWWDFTVFWGLATVLMALHELGHGLTCKHYGGRVTSMGFALIYLTPAFYTDTTEGVIRGNAYQRLMITVAGVWTELGICAIATPLWWGTPPGTAVHDFAYTIILITGIGVVLINWNPLMKLDGYHIVCDLLNIVDLKENSTAYVSAWVKKHIWKLPVDVPYVPKRRRLGFSVYAILSGLYSYSVLFILARFVGNIFRNFNPEWSFIPELATGALIFRSRIRTLVSFMKFVYLDKKDRVRAWFTPRRLRALTAALIVFLFLPVWHELVDGRFVLEPSDRAVVRALQPGSVIQVYADEGQAVVPGAPLFRMRNLKLESRLGRSKADYNLASARANSAVLSYADFGPALQEREHLAQQTRDLASQVTSLDLKSPIAGVVLTPRLSDRLGAYVPAGTELAEVGNLSTLRARIYVSEYDMYKFHSESHARVRFDGMFRKRDAQMVALAPVSSEIAPGLIDLTKYKGLRPPNFYIVDLRVGNADRTLKPGMTGTARLYGRRRSLAGMAWQAVADFFGRKIW